LPCFVGSGWGFWDHLWLCSLKNFIVLIPCIVNDLLRVPCRSSMCVKYVAVELCFCWYCKDLLFKQYSSEFAGSTSTLLISTQVFLIFTHQAWHKFGCNTIHAGIFSEILITFDVWNSNFLCYFLWFNGLVLNKV
jgi:hypothetical protein